MQKEINKRIIFNIPGDTTLVDILEDILRNNGLTESDEEYFNTSQQGKEPRLLIIRDAMLILIQNKVPEKKVIYKKKFKRLRNRPSLRNQHKMEFN